MGIFIDAVLPFGNYRAAVFKPETREGVCGVSLPHHRGWLSPDIGVPLDERMK